MIYELKKADYAKVRELFQPLAYQVIGSALLDGNRLGKVFVDDPDRPKSALLYSVEFWCFLVGDPDNEAFNQSLNTILFDGTLDRNPPVLLMVCHPHDGWKQQLDAILAPRQPLYAPRQHHLCRELTHDWRAALPDGFTVQRLDKALLEQPGLKVPEDIPNWLKEWGSIDVYLAKGFGFVTLHEDEIVAWSLIDGICDDTCEAGIYTAEAYQRRGLGAVTTAALVEHALSNGLTQVSWQCASTNTASIRTAAKVGFEKQRDYLMIHVLTDAEANQKRVQSFVGYFREDAEQALQAGAYWDATIYMDQALDLQETPEAGDYFLSARAWTGRGDEDRGWQDLNNAVDQGWDQTDDTRNCQEFAAFYGRDDWADLLERIGQNVPTGE